MIYMDKECGAYRDTLPRYEIRWMEQHDLLRRSLIFWAAFCFSIPLVLVCKMQWFTSVLRQEMITSCLVSR